LGLAVALVQDRPVLGGNASSEVRLWILGATSHMGNNNRWAREGGVIDEILVENLFRNPEGNPVIFDSILLEKATTEPKIRLFLNTAVHGLEKEGDDAIRCVRAFCSQNSTEYRLSAPLFVDASGDGILGYLSGAAFRMGAEASEEFGEPLAPDESYGSLLGHTLYFYSKDTGRPVRFVPPAFALKDITQIPRFRGFNARDYGCRLWWIEYGGRLDTVHDTERIKWELWKIVYGVWNHIKNSGQFPEAETSTLEWVGQIPGKRESRRFEGDYILAQRDIIEQHLHADAVAHGGWAVDLHPADGIYSELPGCNQWHSRGVYQIPYRCLYSRNIRNLFLAGRIISASHVAFGSIRVQATLSAAAQAVAAAAVRCRAEGLYPRDMLEPERMRMLQRTLTRLGQFIPDFRETDPADLAQSAVITASSSLRLSELPGNGDYLSLDYSYAQMLPVKSGRLPRFTFQARAAGPSSLRIELRTSDRPANYTPDVLLAFREVRLEGGISELDLDFDVTIDTDRYVFLTFLKNDRIQLLTSRSRITGILAVSQRFNEAVAESGIQEPPADREIGVERFEFWTPPRRPLGQNLALRIDPPLEAFEPSNVANGVARPTDAPNAWVADFADSHPRLTLSWPQPVAIRRVELSFDTDFDHPMESVLMGHPERVMPFCVRSYSVRSDDRVVAAVNENHQTRNALSFESPLITRSLTIEVERALEDIPTSILELRCYP